jgi:hypothetical protein
MRGTTLSFLLVSSLGACVADGYSTDVSALGGENLNGENLNGENLNGENLNGSELGKAVKWVELAGVTLDGAWLPWVWLDGSQLMGWQGGAVLEGDALVGARFVARSDTNKWLKLRVADVESPADGDDVWRYWVEYLETNGQWYPICLDTAGDAFGAIPVDGYWNHKRGVPHGGDKIDDPWRFTFACPRVGAIGKCVEAGYEPWAYTADGTSLADHHQACVRLMRADYCGDGEPHTVDGTLVNLYDQIGIQDDADDWIHEAEWGPDGASCISPHNRHVEPVKCYDRLIRDDCGASFSDGTLLISETPEDAE